MAIMAVYKKGSLALIMGVMGAIKKGILVLSILSVYKKGIKKVFPIHIKRYQQSEKLKVEWGLN